MPAPASSARRHATSAGTRAYAERHGSLGRDAFRRLGRTGWSASALGFGAYRVEAGQLGHREALAQALGRGVNLIDTSSNYTDGGSETLIGALLREAGSAELPAREEVVVVSKVGYVQGQNMQVVKEALDEGHGFPEMVEYHPQCWHCIHPTFLEDQLERSLKRLQVDSLDVYLLHNPEYFFSDRMHRHSQGGLDDARAEFYRRCEAAFAWLEAQVGAGQILWYGVSSNSFGHAAAHPEFVSLQRLLDAAGAAAGAVHGAGAASHFAIVQCPLNLFEAGPALEHNQPDGSTFLELAGRADLGVLVNRPLNALNDGQLTRLAGFPPLRANWSAALAAALARQLAQEQDFATRFRPAVAARLPEGAHELDPFNWAGAFRDLPPALREHDAWMQVLHSTVYPQIERNGQAVMGGLTEPSQQKDFAAWFRDYAASVEASASLVGEGLGRFRAEAGQAVQARLAPLLPHSVRAAPLSQQALLVTRSVPGVTCILNGIRRVEYVDDSMASLALAALAPDEALAVLRKLGAAARI